MKDWAFFKYSRRKVKLILRKFSSQKKVLKFQLEVSPIASQLHHYQDQPLVYANVCIPLTSHHQFNS